MYSLQYTAAYCSTLQLAATPCNTLQHTATHTATPCNSLQHITQASDNWNNGGGPMHLGNSFQNGGPMTRGNSFHSNPDSSALGPLNPNFSNPTP